MPPHQRDAELHRLPRRARAQLDLDLVKPHAGRAPAPQPQQDQQPQRAADPNLTAAGIQPIEDQNASMKAATTSIANTPSASRAPRRPPSTSASTRRRRPARAPQPEAQASTAGDDDRGQFERAMPGDEAPERIAQADAL